MSEVGYRYFLTGEYPGGENRLARDIEFLQSLGIPVVTVSPGNRTRR